MPRGRKLDEKPSDSEINNLINRRYVPISFTPGEVVDEILEDLSTEFRKMIGTEKFEELFPKGLLIEKYKTRSVLEAFCERVICEQHSSTRLKNRCKDAVLHSSAFLQWKQEQVEIIERGEKEFTRTRVSRNFRGPGPMD